MIARLVAASLKAPIAIFALALALLLAGALAFRHVDFEATTSALPTIVEVIAEPAGMSAEDVERSVVAPLEMGLAGTPGLEHTRAQSLFGLATIACTFRPGVDYADARQQVSSRLATTELPAGVHARVSPKVPLAEVFRYELVGKGHDLRELKSTQDWLLRRQLQRVPGVADVVSFGGETKEYHVDVDPFRLREHGVSLEQVTSALQHANTNVGGPRLALGEQAYTIRGIGLVRDVHDIGSIVVGARAGVPVRIHDVATVELGSAPRVGIAGRDGREDVVLGTILMRPGSDVQATLSGIHARLAGIRDEQLLPAGMEVVPLYDRADVLAATGRTAITDVMVGLGLAIVVLVLLLGRTRAVVVVAVNLPLAALVTFIALAVTGTPASIATLGAIDLGVVVTSAVVMTDAISGFLGARGDGSMSARVLAAASSVARPLLLSTSIALVLFLPLLGLRGVAGAALSPTAHAYVFAIAGTALLATTLTPALASQILPNQTQRESAAMRALRKSYAPLLRFGSRRPWLALLAGALPVVVGLAAFRSAGDELVPKLEEGDLWIRATLPASISLEESAKYVGRMREIVRGCPAVPTACDETNRRHREVVTVVSQLGRPDDGTFRGGFQDIELFAPLLPRGAWPRASSKKQLVEQIALELRQAFPTVTFDFSQAATGGISSDVNEALTGVAAESTVQIFGERVADDEHVAERVVSLLRSERGIRDVGLFRSTGQPSVRIAPNREVCARYGLTTSNVASFIEAALGGAAITQVLEGDRRFDLTVRWRGEYRDSVEAVQELTVFTPDGIAIPLGQLADITMQDSPSVLYREDGARYTPVKLAVRGADPFATIATVQARVAKLIELDDAAHVTWTGQVSELLAARERVTALLAATLALVVLLVFAATRNLRDTAVVLSGVPIACAGGALGLCVANVDFSLSAAAGFATACGVAIQDALFVVTSFQRLLGPEKSIEEAAAEAAQLRLRPMLITALVAIAGLLPVTISRGLGAESQQPFAFVVIGGALFVIVVARLVHAPLLVLLHHFHFLDPLSGRALRGDSLNGT